MSVYRRGKVWWFHFQFEQRQIQESSGFTNRTAALRAEAKRKTDLLDRRAGLSRKALPPKFEEYIPQFLAWSERQHRPKTHALHRLNCDVLLRCFHGCWLDEITPGMVEDFKLARSRDERRNGKGAVSPATVNRALTTLKLLFNHARRCGLAVENPAEQVSMLEENSNRMRVLSYEEECRYLAAAGPTLRDIATVMLGTGMRPEEVFRIEAGNVDFLRRALFNPFGKTKAARRTVPLSDAVLSVLKQRAIKARGLYLFPSRHDTARPLGTIRKAHDLTWKRAGIAESFRLYDLRHTYASRAAMAGVDLPTLAALLGHSKIQMTMRYVHPAEQHKRLAASQVESFRLAQQAEERESEPLQEPLQ